MSATPVKVGVVVVHYGDPDPTRTCIASIADDPSPVEREVAVVDNTRTAPPVGSAHVVVLPQAHNPGYGGGANRGVEVLRDRGCEVVATLNNDVEVLPGFLAAAASLPSLPEVGAAGGPIFTGHDRRELWYAGGGISFLTGTVWQSRSPRDARLRRRVGFVPGTAMIVTTAAWQAVGGYDPRFFLYHEDVDLCLRLRRRGYTLLFHPDLAVVHHLGSSTGSHELSPIYLENLARTRFRPFRPFAYRLYLAALHTGYVALRARRLGQAGDERGRTAAEALRRGHRAALRDLPEGPRP